MENEQNQKCLQWRDEALSKNPMVKFIRKALEKQGCRMKNEHFICEPCSEKVAGGFDPHRGVVLCQNALMDVSHTIDSISHELIHAFDHCRAKIDWDDCRHHACAEIRAANLSGDCHFIKEFMRGHRKINKQQQECVKRRALLSVSMNPKCTEALAKQAVNEVFDTCFADTAPFDRIP